MAVSATTAAVALDDSLPQGGKFLMRAFDHEFESGFSACDSSSINGTRVHI
jgi:hypothetical protein